VALLSVVDDGRGVEAGRVTALPPHDLEAEQATLGAAMLSADALAIVLGQLREDDFYRPAHRGVYVAVSALQGRGDPVDAITVAGELDRAGALADVGGAPFLHTLVASVPTAANTDHYARRVRDLATLRRVIDAGHQFVQLGHEIPQDPSRAIEHARRMVEEIAERAQVVDGAEAALEVDDFLNEPEPDYDFLIPGLLERGDRTIITGLEGAGKSTLKRQIAVQAAAGIHPFTLESISPIRVLLLDCENSRLQVKREVRPLRLRAGAQLKRGRLYIVVVPQGIDLYGEAADVAWLEARIKRAAPDLLIIGPLYKLATGDPISEEVARKVSAVLDDLRVRYRFALLIEAHVPHGGQGSNRPTRPYGASMWMRWPEFGLYLSDTGTLSHWRGQRDERDWPSSLKRGGDWPWTPTQNPREVLWGRIVARCQEDGRTYSVAWLARLLEAGKGSVQRAIEVHRTEWEELKKALGEAE
jgi:DnaB helicase-like protein/AAA domain-containing protein